MKSVLAEAMSAGGENRYAPGTADGPQDEESAMAHQDQIPEPLESKAVEGLIEELERQAAERPSKLKVRREGDRIVVDGEVDVDALAMVVIGAMAGGP